MGDRLVGPAKTGPLAACLCVTHRAPLYYLHIERGDEGHTVQYPYAGLVEALRSLRSQDDEASLWRRAPQGWKQVSP